MNEAVSSRQRLSGGAHVSGSSACLAFSAAGLLGALQPTDHLPKRGMLPRRGLGVWRGGDACLVRTMTPLSVTTA